MTGSKTEIRPGVWRLRAYLGRRPNGTPIQITKTVRGPNKKAGSGSRLADRELAKLVAQVDAGKHVGGTETLGGLLDIYLRHCEDRGLAATTMREHRREVEKIIGPALGAIRLSRLTARDLDRLYTQLTARGLKASSVRRVHALVSAALHQGEKWDLVAVNVARRASPPAVRATQVEAPSREEVLALVAAAERIDPTLAALLSIAALTGARRGELCGLRWADLDWPHERLTVRHSVYETAGGGWAEKAPKTHQRRTLSVRGLAVDVLRAHRAAVDALASTLELDVRTDAFMFSRSPQGLEPIRPDVVSKFVARAAKAAGIETHLHALRHFSATQLVGAGIDIRTVAGRLGHADAGITLRVYAHALPEADRNAADVLGRSLTPGGGG